MHFLLQRDWSFLIFWYTSGLPFLKRPSRTGLVADSIKLTNKCGLEYVRSGKYYLQKSGGRQWYKYSCLHQKQNIPYTETSNLLANTREV